MRMRMAFTVRVGCGSLVSEGCWPPVCVCGAAEEKWNSTRRLQQHLHRHHQHQKHSGWLWRKEQNEIQQVFFQSSTSPRLYLIKMNSISKSFGTRQMVSRWVEHIFKWVVVQSVIGIIGVLCSFSFPRAEHYCLWNKNVHNFIISIHYIFTMWGCGSVLSTPS